jgi:hypothetical protein
MESTTVKLDFDKIWLMFQETDKKFQETDTQIKNLGKHIGGLGHKFGTFTEGLFMPSVKKLLLNEFKCKTVTKNYIYNNGISFEIDMIGDAGENVYLVEIKSHLNDSIFPQMQRHIQQFKEYVTRFKGSKIFGIVVATHFDAEIVSKLYESGYYFISVSNKIAKLNIPESFLPKEW